MPVRQKRVVVEKNESLDVIHYPLSDDSAKKLKVISSTLKVDENEALEILMNFATPEEIKKGYKETLRKRELFELEAQITELETRKRELLNVGRSIPGRTAK